MVLNDFKFENPDYLLLIVFCLILAIACYYWTHLATVKLRKFILDSEKFTPKALGWQSTAILLGFCFLILALARPQANPKSVESQSQSLDIMVLLDVSKSMDAEDIFPSRLSKAKHSIELLLDELSGDRVGIIAFAANAVLVSPLTTDYTIVKSFLSAVDTSTIPTQGTNIERAINLATNSFLRGSAQNFNPEDRSHIMLLLSDGEATTGDDLQAVKTAKEKGILIHSIAVGTTRGAPIPIKDAEGNALTFKTDRSRNTVISKVNHNALKKIATTSGGFFFVSTPGENEIRKIARHSLGLKRSMGKNIQAKLYSEYFYIPLGIGFCLILFGFAPMLRTQTLALFILFTFINPNQLRAQNNSPTEADKKQKTEKSFLDKAVHSFKSIFYSKEKRKSNQAIDDFMNGRISSAEKSFLELQANDPKSPVLAYDTGSALAKNKKFIQGRNLLKKSKKLARNIAPELEWLANLNLAGTHAEEDKKDKAMQEYATLIDKLNKLENKSQGIQWVLNQARKNLEFLSQEKKQNQSGGGKGKGSGKGSKSDKDKSKSGSKGDSDSSGNPQDESKDPNSENKDGDEESENNEQKGDKPGDSEENPKDYTNKNQSKKFQGNQRLSESDARKILNSLEQYEKDLQKRFLKRKSGGKRKPSPNGKDW